MPTSPETSKVEIYSPAARRFHWWTVALVAIQVPLGFYMAYRGNDLNIWDGLTNALYSSHKLLGLIILVLVIARLGYRIAHGSPRPEPTITTWQRELGALSHEWIYLLLIVTPILGWLGASLYPALDIFGMFNLPSIAAENQEMSTTVFLFHVAAAIGLVALIGMHIGAALYHRLVRRDQVLSRMLPGPDQA